MVVAKNSSNLAWPRIVKRFVTTMICTRHVQVPRVFLYNKSGYSVVQGSHSIKILQKTSRLCLFRRLRFTVDKKKRKCMIQTAFFFSWDNNNHISSAQGRKAFPTFSSYDRSPLPIWYNAYAGTIYNILFLCIFTSEVHVAYRYIIFTRTRY